jgi:hypothetical protein
MKINSINYSFIFFNQITKMSDQEIDEIINGIVQNTYDLSAAPFEVKDCAEIADFVAMYKGGIFFEYVSDRFKDNVEYILKMIDENPHLVRYISLRLQVNRIIISKAVELDASVFQFIPEHFKADREIALASIDYIDGSALYHIPESVFEDEEFVHQALIKCYHILNFLPERYRTDADLIRPYIRRNGLLYMHLSEELKRLEEFMKYAVLADPDFLFETMPEFIRGNKDFVLEVVARNGLALQYAAEYLKNDVDIAIEAILNNGFSYKYISEELKSKTYITRIAIKNKPRIVAVLDDIHKENKELMICAVQQDPTQLKNVSDYLKNDFDMVYEAVSKQGMSLQHAADPIRNYDEIVLVAVENNGMALEFASNQLKNNPNIVLRAVRNNGKSYQFASDTLKNRVDIALEAFKNSRGASLFMTDEMRSRVVQAYFNEFE